MVRPNAPAVAATRRADCNRDGPPTFAGAWLGMGAFLFAGGFKGPKARTIAFDVDSLARLITVRTPNKAFTKIPTAVDHRHTSGCCQSNQHGNPPCRRGDAQYLKPFQVWVRNKRKPYHHNEHAGSADNKREKGKADSLAKRSSIWW